MWWMWLGLSLLMAQDPSAAEDDDEGPEEVAAPSGDRSEATCQNLRFGSARELERVLRGMQRNGLNQFMMVGDRMICGWRLR